MQTRYDAFWKDPNRLCRASSVQLMLHLFHPTIGRERHTGTCTTLHSNTCKASQLPAHPLAQQYLQGQSVSDQPTHLHTSSRTCPPHECNTSICTMCCTLYLATLPTLVRSSLQLLVLRFSCLFHPCTGKVTSY